MLGCRAVSHSLLALRAPPKTSGSVDPAAIGLKGTDFLSGALAKSSCSLFSISAGRRKRGCKRMASNSSVIRASAPKLENADELIDSVETFLFDCDGVPILSLSLPSLSGYVCVCIYTRKLSFASSCLCASNWSVCSISLPLISLSKFLDTGGPHIFKIISFLYIS